MNTPIDVSERVRQSLHLYNTLGASLERFEPLNDRRVQMYVCGPTVYSHPHIGNMRMYIIADQLRRVLMLAGFDVEVAMNITDVGHLTSDADEGEDKMAKAAAREHATAWEVAERYTKAFFADTERLNILPVDHVLKATDHITEQIELIQRLEAKGVVYHTNDGLYFDTKRISDYGKLTPHDDRTNLNAGGRVDLRGKRHHTDFALWKFSPDGPRRDMEWPSPWGTGFPGWHLECSAMAMSVFGETLDIHTGGIDHIPIHHTNEIAQSETATGKPFSRWWVHGAFLTVEGDQRMGKSEGNFVTLETLESQGYDPLEYRYLILSSHYRSPLSFTSRSLDAAARSWRRLVQHAAALRTQVEAPTPDVKVGDPYVSPFLDALADDINTPRAMAVLWGLVRDDTIDPAAKLAALRLFDDTLGLKILETETAFVEIDPSVRDLAERRWLLRQARRFAESDDLREEITRAGFTVLDRKDGYELVPIVE